MDVRRKVCFQLTRRKQAAADRMKPLFSHICMVFRNRDGLFPFSPQQSMSMEKLSNDAPQP
jgi:hypothetical protein